MKPSRPSPVTLIALIALVGVLSGTAVAASRYVITSITQIKPRVLAELHAPVANAATSNAGVYEVELSEPVIQTSEWKTLKLPSLPAGAYEVLGTAVLAAPETRGLFAAECVLAAGSETDIGYAWFAERDATTLSSSLTHVFHSTGEVTMKCIARGDDAWNLEKGTRIMALKVATQHKIIASAE